MARLPNIDSLITDGKVGDWAFNAGDDDYIGIVLYEPQDWDNGITVLRIFLSGTVAPTSAYSFWYWDGNRDAPTLNPSILHHGAREWHGYLRAGRLEEV